MKKILKSRKTIRGMAATLALLLTLNGCGFGKNNNVDIPEDPAVSYEQNIDDIHDHEHNHDHEHDDVVVTPTLPNTIIDNNTDKTTTGEEENTETVTPVKPNTNTNNNNGVKNPTIGTEKPVQEEITKPVNEMTPLEMVKSHGEITVDENGRYVVNGLIIPDLSKSSYKGVSIVDALYLEGYRYDKQYVRDLAEFFYIENFRGTAAQNTLLLEYLRTWAKDLDLTQTAPGQTPSDPTNPGINENHDHKYGKWMSFNDEKEYRGCSCGDIDYREHSYTDWVDLGNGNEMRTCKTCGHSMVREIQVVEEHTHEFGEWKLVKKATCTEEGQEERVCLECGEKEYRNTPKEAHKFGGWSSWTPWSTPDKDGIQTRTRYKTCKDCGERVVDTQTRVYVKPNPGHEHSMTGWITQKQPTCTEDGLKVNSCRKCDYSISQIITKLGHKLGFIKKDPTCTEKGFEGQACERCDYQVGSTTNALGHDYQEINRTGWALSEDGTVETCTVTYECTRCGEKKTEVLTRTPQHTHKPMEVEGKEATCTEDGYTAGTICKVCGETLSGMKKINKLGHNFTVELSATEWALDEDGKTESRDVTLGCSRCDATTVRHETRPYSPEHEHDYTEFVETVAPTCTEQGYDIYRCPKDGSTMRKNYVDALGHTLGDWEVVKEATETEDGLKVQKCTVCGEIINQEVIPALGKHEHKYTEFVETVAPTCTEQGYDVYKCPEDGTTINKNYVDALGHTLGDWEVVKEATETEDGLKVQKCTVCGEIINQEVIPAKGHTHVWGEWNITKEPTCTEDGEKTRTCQDGHVDTEVIPALGHEVEEVEAVAPTCTEKGYTAGTRCKVCGETLSGIEEVPATGHTLGDWEVVKEATETEDGLKVQKCTVCGEIINQEVIPAKGHTHIWGEWVKTSEATCTSPEVWTRTCQDGHIETEERGVALGHTEVTVRGKDATCEEAGLTEGKKCSVCGEVIVEQSVIPATGHSWGEVQSVEAGCTTEGSTYQSCSNCDKINTLSTIPATGHSYGAPVTTQQPSCTEAGSKSSTCSGCGDVHVETIAATGHNLRSSSYYDELDEETVITWSCTACDYSYEERIPGQSTPSKNQLKIEVEQEVVVVPEQTEGETVVIPEQTEGETVVIPEQAEGETVVIPEQVEGETVVIPEQTEEETVVVPEQGQQTQEELSALQAEYEEASAEYVELVTELQAQETQENSYSEGGMVLTLTPEV